MPTKKRIIPEKDKCSCGKKVLNHHWLCDDCYSNKQKEENRRKTKKILDSQKHNLVLKRKTRYKKNATL